MTKIYHGSCLCGETVYEVHGPFGHGSDTEGTVCTKMAEEIVEKMAR